jgi:membrane-associated protease RseP (regulator of RpoE activity)
MSNTVGIILFVIAILVTIVIHEAAHFGFAKWFGIKVEEFFVGFGPRIWSTRRGETEYGVKALPLGGYVRIAGMNPLEEIPPEKYPRTFGAKPAWQRAIVIAAGPATHFVVAFVFFALWLGLVGQQVERGVEFAAVAKTLGASASPAAVAGLQPGDRVVRIDGVANPTPQQLYDETQRRGGKPVTLVIVRDGSRVSETMTPVRAKVEGQLVWRIGVLTQPAAIVRERTGPVSSVSEGARMVGSTTVLAVKSLGRLFDVGRIYDELFGGAPRQVTDPASLVGVARIAGQTAQHNFGDLLVLLASLNIFIGLLNLLPLPPFDGGHLAVIAIEKVTRRKVDMRRLIPITALVATFLIIFVGSLLLLDILKPIPLP